MEKSLKTWKIISKDGLPKKSGYYLVMDGSLDCYAVGYFMEGVGKFTVPSYFWKDYDVVAWADFVEFDRKDEL